jgi:hypothetical protein
MTDPTIFRFLRVLEYVGTREALDSARKNRGVKGSRDAGPSLKIFEGIVGDSDQPVVGQLKKWCCEQLVAAADGELFPDNDSMRDGYVDAVREVLRLTLPASEYEALCGKSDK